MPILDLHNKVTIGIPVYNEVRFIRETLESAIIQGVTVIVSDNASTDETSEICREYADKGLIQYIRHTENQGAWRNFMLLPEKATTPYFMWLGGHDVLLKGYVEKLVAYMCNDLQSVVCFSAIQRCIDAEGKHIRDVSEIESIEEFYRSQNSYKRVLAALQYKAAGMAFYGLYEIKTLRFICKHFQTKVILSFDVPFLVALASLGKFGYLPEVGYIRRDFREPETYSRMLQRQIEMLFTDKDSKIPSNILSNFKEAMLDGVKFLPPQFILKRLFTWYAKFILYRQGKSIKRNFPQQKNSASDTRKQ
jgi:glycosyltransferase involved in cell wall biosynthesis